MILAAWAPSPSMFFTHPVVAGPGGDPHALGIVLTSVAIGYTVALGIAAILWWRGIL